uniref:Rab-GAP TBC domain-containing protein n=1 Tax=Triparma pacifica TaxID=91992 RepID=A0A7S2QVH7_9STRA|mmetsp:Transcript_1724/g.3294  ORF Transcript_1724/g.3294 Transcript_1724/m.3294 type:complete len:609 (+) Transcript_1724:23-1849(+)
MLAQRWLTCVGLGHDDLSELYTAYRTLLDQHLPSVHSGSGSSADPLAVDDPLSVRTSSEGTGDDSWKKFYSANELLNEIKIDLSRLYLNSVPPAYFQSSPSKLEAVQNILFLSCTLLHPSISYRQGMHELCGLIYYAISEEPSGVSPHHVESVAWNVFDAVLNSVVSLYDPRTVEQLTEQQERINAKNRVQPKTRPVHTCELIFNNLKQIDRPLHERISSYILPQLFFLKWLRLLCVREFHVQDSIAIFDNVITSLPAPPIRDTLENLSYKPLPPIISNLGLALILEVRDTIMSSDENGILEALMRYQFPGGGNGRVEGGQYKRVGRESIDRLFKRARDIGSGNAGSSAAPRRTSPPQPTPTHTHPTFSNDGSGVMNMLSKTSSSIMTSIASKVEESKPAWLLGGGGTSGDPLGVEDVEDEEASFVGGGGGDGGETRTSQGIFGLSDSLSPSTVEARSEPQPLPTSREASPVKAPQVKPKSDTKATLDFLTGGMESGRSTKTRADVFGASDDDESESEDEESLEEEEVIAKKIGTMQFLETAPNPPPNPSPAPLPDSHLQPASSPAPNSNELKNAVATIKRYMQDEGAGAPRSVWAAIEVFERQAGVK